MDFNTLTLHSKVIIRKKCIYTRVSVKTTGENYNSASLYI